MTRRSRVGERHVWIALVAVLATSLAWLSTLVALMGARGWLERKTEWIVIVRAIVRVVESLAPLAQAVLPLVVVALVMSGVVMALVAGGAVGVKREVRHG